MILLVLFFSIFLSFLPLFPCFGLPSKRVFGMLPQDGRVFPTWWLKRDSKSTKGHSPFMIVRDRLLQILFFYLKEFSPGRQRLRLPRPTEDVSGPEGPGWSPWGRDPQSRPSVRTVTRAPHRAHLSWESSTTIYPLRHKFGNH